MIMTYREKYTEWLTFDEETKAELIAITDEKEIEDRFYKDLAFGTGGLRGIMGAGSNRMNKYTVGKATYGLAKCTRAKKSRLLWLTIHEITRLTLQRLQQGFLLPAALRCFFMKPLFPFLCFHSQLHF